ncbi:MAG: ABC transporter permease [Syntrophomonadaceae bacterium]|nr:ABC transporter permease [Syntrophomonadaceae bacterium]
MKRDWVAYPYMGWMLVFVTVPLVLLLYNSVIIDSGSGTVRFTLEHFGRVLEPMYLSVIWRSIMLALVSTVICLVLGYPMAMIIANSSLKTQYVLIILFIIPMWMNFLARTYAWMTLLEKTGLFSQFLRWLGLPVTGLLHTDFAVILGMVYNFLPFMIFPIYVVLRKMDKSLLEASRDLGATPLMTFRRVVFPLSLSGVLSGVTLVFMPAVTTFAIPQLLGGGHYTMIGNLIEQQYLRANDWGFGSALSIILIVIILLSMALIYKVDRKEDGGLMI